MKSIFTFVFFASITASAQSFISLDCKTAKPCAYAEDLGKCVSSIQVHGRIGGNASETINYRPENITYEIFLIPDQYEVSVAATSRGVEFQDETGDQNGYLQHIPGGKLKGSITVDQDFEFKVTCTNKAIGFE